MSALNTTYTVDDGWRFAITDLKKVKNAPKYMKLELSNRAAQIAQGMVGDVVAPAYMTDINPVQSNVSKVGSSGMSYANTTKRLTATMSIAFASTDEGKMITFAQGNNTYWATIQTWISTAIVVLTGDSLPAADIATIDSIHVIATVFSDDIDISALRMLRYGSEINLKIATTATKYVKRINQNDFDKFQPTAADKLDVLVWTLIGVKIRINRGSSIANNGTLTFTYPRLPLVRSLTTDYLDVLEGNMMWLYVAVLRNLIAKRIGEEAQDNKEEIINLIQAVYREFSGKVSTEEAKAKAEDIL